MEEETTTTTTTTTTAAAVSWESLPEVPMLQVFSYLSAKELCCVASVCSAWSGLSREQSLWRRLFAEVWDHSVLSLRSEPQQQQQKREEDYKTMFKNHALQYRPYISCFASVKSLWDRALVWMEGHAPEVVKGLAAEASQAAIDELENEVGCSLPLDYKCSLRLHNGQLKDSSALSFWGSYSFYDNSVCMHHCAVEDAKRFHEAVKNIQSMQWLRRCIPIALNVVDSKFLLMLLEDVEGQGKAGNIIAPSGNYANSFWLADSFSDFLQSYVEDLESGIYQPNSDGQISLFPLKGPGVASEVTRDICVTASPLFVPELSVLPTPPSAAGTTPTPRYYWAYRISMSMAESSSYRRSQLLSRHWQIKDGNGHVEEVEGPGVIGLHPIMSPGANFQYESCCPLATPNGTMKGSFTMIYETGEKFDVVVPEFTFMLPVERRRQQKAQKESSSTEDEETRSS